MGRLSGSAPHKRVNGVQMHPTSLPGGRLGEEGGPPYKSPSAFAGSPELLAEPEAPVSAAELDALREREAYWLPDWEGFAGPGAGEDQVRFDREWAALRAYAAERGVRIIGDLPIYVAEDGADHRAHPELFQTGVQAGGPAHAFPGPRPALGQPAFEQ